LILPWFTLAPESAGTGRRVVELLRPRAVLLVHVPTDDAAASQIDPEAIRGLPPVFLLTRPGETLRLAEDSSGFHLTPNCRHHEP
jgi:acetyl esterase/lipase